MLKTYTVISLDEFERDVETVNVEAKSAYHAMCKVAEDSDGDRLIIGAFEVDTLALPQFHTPSEDNNSPACAVDMRGLIDCWDGEDSGDDSCDICMRSGVQVARTDGRGKTVCDSCDDEETLCDCGGGGWFLCQDAGHGDETNGQAEVQRCDACQRYDDDDLALRAFMEYVRNLEIWVSSRDPSILQDLRTRGKDADRMQSEDKEEED